MNSRNRIERGVQIALGAAVFAMLVAGCSSTRLSGDDRSSGSSAGDGSARGGGLAQGGSAPRRGGGYYLDDGPGDSPPPDLDAIPDAVPRAEPVLAHTSRPYTVFGRQYRPMSELQPYKARGVATWYGRRYHGNPTSSGERYDMYGMTAAHPTLPIPSYARVTHLGNGRSVVVRVNDRGPFLDNRLIDLSYTAAAKLGYIGTGSAEVEVELITEFGEPLAPTLAAAPASAAGVGAVPAGAASAGATSAAITSAGATSAAATSAGATSAGATSAGATSAGATSAGAASRGGAPIVNGSPAMTMASTDPARPPVPSGAGSQAGSVLPDAPAPSGAGDAEAPRLTVETEYRFPPAEPEPLVAPPRATLAGGGRVAEAAPRPADVPGRASAPTASVAAGVPSAAASPASLASSAPSAAPASLPAASAGLPVPALDRGYWLQLGAFRSAGNAGAARERVGKQVGGLGAALDVVPDNGLFKLQAGPWATREAAQAAAERVRAVTGMEAFATQR